EGEVEELRGSGRAGEHLRAVECPRRRPGEAVPAEVVRRHVVRIRPEPELRIVGEVAPRERITVVGTCGIAGGRDRDALEVWDRAPVGARARELGGEPSIGDLRV